MKIAGLKKEVALKKALIEALRPKTLTASILPVIVGTFLAGSAVNKTLFFSLLLTALLIQIGTNLVNDAFDFVKKADSEERLGPKRLIQKGFFNATQVLKAGTGAFMLSVLTALPMIYFGGPLFALILAVSIFLGYVYTAGPYPLAYKGLGELFVILFFGLVLTGSASYLQTGVLSLASLVAGLQLGLFSTVLIAINNLRDIKQDRKADKRTLAVRWGERFARIEIAVCALTPFLLNIYWLERGWVMLILPFFTLPLAVALILEVAKNRPGVIYNSYLKEAGLLHAAFGLLLTVGALLS